MIKRISSVLLLLILFAVPSFAATLPIYGPEKFQRIEGKPEEFKDSFTVCNTASSYRIIVERGYDEGFEEKEDEEDKENKEKGKSFDVLYKSIKAEIEINDEDVIEEDDFRRDVKRVEKEVTLSGENTIEIEVEGKPGGYVLVSIECVTNCLDAAIATPVDGSAINKSKTIVKGSLYNAYGETGVTIGNAVSEGSARFQAYREGNNFAGLVPLAQGANRLTVTATDACGQKAEDTVAVLAAPSAEQIRLSINPSSGVPDIKTGMLDVEFRADAYGGDLTYAWDFDGDGIADKSGADMSSVTFGYSQSGLYFPTVTVTDSKGNSYAETAVVNVMSKDEVDALLKGKWDGMKEGLASGDIEKALRYFHEGSRDKYREAFKVLGGDLPSIATGMQDMTFLYAKGNTAKCRVLRNQVIDGQAMTITYYTYFYLDVDGIWRIESF